MKKKLPSFLIERAQSWFKNSNNSLPSDGFSFSYIIKYSGNGRRSDILPMLIALHGDGDTTDNFYETALDQFNVPVRIILIKAPILHDMGDVWPYSASQFAKYGKTFSVSINKLTTTYPTVGKPILLGFSGGGTMAYYQAVKHGDSYSYIFAISGLLFKEQLAGRSCRPSAKVYAYHGKNDEVVPFSAGEVAVNLLKKRGVKINFTEFEGDHHGLFTHLKSKITLTIEEKIKKLK
jgi:phospholipase/carboxylesterase